MNYIIETILDLLFPRRCPVCGQIIMPKGNLICPGCIRKLSWVRGPVCKCCGKEIISETAEYCSDCAIIQDLFPMGWRCLTIMKFQHRPWQRSSITTIGNIWIFMQRLHIESMLPGSPAYHRILSFRCRYTKSRMKKKRL